MDCLLFLIAHSQNGLIFTQNTPNVVIYWIVSNKNVCRAHCVVVKFTFTIFKYRRLNMKNGVLLLLTEFFTFIFHISNKANIKLKIFKTIFFSDDDISFHGYIILSDFWPSFISSLIST